MCSNSELRVHSLELESFVKNILINCICLMIDFTIHVLSLVVVEIYARKSSIHVLSDRVEIEMHLFIKQ